MATFIVNIGGNDYQLKGDDDGTARKAAEEVNAKMRELNRKHKDDLPPLTLSVLTALNIAESEMLSRRHIENENELISNELNKMAEYLGAFISK